VRASFFLSVTIGGIAVTCHLVDEILSTKQEHESAELYQICSAVARESDVAELS